MKHMVASLVIAEFAVGLLSSSTFVSAAPNPSGTGPPNQTCQDFGSFVRPAGAAGPLATGTSPGSVFNEPGAISGPGGTGGNGGTGGTGGAAYNAAGAPSQYDVACFQQSVNHPLPPQ